MASRSVSIDRKFPFVHSVAPWPPRHIPPDGALSPDGSVYIDGTGQTIRFVHSSSRCAGRACVIHAPSQHRMRGFRTHFRFDRYLMERICPHGVGHPDPDDLAWRPEDDYLGVHGCDGCCSR